MAAHYLYRCYADDGSLVYVGESKDAATRLDHHRRTAVWADLVVRVTVKVYRSKIEAREAEKHAIKFEGPRFNNMGRWATRAMWSRRDYHDYVTALMAGAGWYTPSVRNRIEFVFRTYATRYGQKHPAQESVRAAMVAHDEKIERSREESHAAHLRRRELHPEVYA